MGLFWGISPENNTESGFSGCRGVNTLVKYHVRRGELHSPSHDTDGFPYLRNNGTQHQGYCMSCRDAMLRIFSPTGLNVIFIRFHLIQKVAAARVISIPDWVRLFYNKRSYNK